MRVRKLMVLAQRVTDAADGVDEARAPAGLGLASKVADVDIEGVGRRAEVEAPDALEDDRASEHLTRIAQKELEQRELGSRQLDRSSPRAHLSRAEIELEVGEAKDVSPPSPFPARRSRARSRASSSASANGFDR